MSQENRQLREITPMEEDFAQWYTDIVKKAELIDYSSVRGCVVMRPYAYAIWENLSGIFDRMIKATGHQNVAMPLFIPESLLNKEKEHVEGFAPEVAWVTHGGSEKLEERLCIRPTSETLFCEHYAHIIQSYRDLPKLYNQWCSVVRWEKSTRPFLRSREFWWQEGHTAHATPEEAMEETLAILSLYAELAEQHLCMPVIQGQKTEKEKFAGAVKTYSIEAMMHDGRALQSGTSHYFGDGFARAFGIQFLDKDNALKHVFQTSWGISTRLIGGIIMTHGDNRGLKLPPAVAPVQVMIVPIAQHKPGVIDRAAALCEALKAAGICADLDASEQSAGWKFAQHEMRGVPLRLELGPRDIENNRCVLVRRDDGSKREVPLEHIAREIKTSLDEYAQALFASARTNLENNIRDAATLEEMKQAIADRPRFVRAMWCGDQACEEKIKEETGMPSRCIPFDQRAVGEVCPACGKPASTMVIYGLSY